MSARFDETYFIGVIFRIRPSVACGYNKLCPYKICDFSLGVHYFLHFIFRLSCLNANGWFIGS